METEKRNSSEHEGHFYKGLFFGVLVGVGLIWFLQSDSGKRLVKKARNRLDEALSFEPGMEDFEEEMAEDPSVSTSVKKPSSNSSRRFFKKNSK